MSSVSLSVRPLGSTVSSAASSQPATGISTADLSRLSRSPETESVQLQARRDVVIQRFVQTHGLACKGDIQSLMEEQAKYLVQQGLCPTADEAGTALINAYRTFVRRQDPKKVREAIAAAQDPQTAKAIGQERAERPVREARLKWLEVHKEMQRRFNVDATVPDWRKRCQERSLWNMSHNDGYCLRGLLKEEGEALQQLQQAAEKRRRAHPQAEYAKAASDLEKFEMFLRFCKGDFRRQIFVQKRVLDLQARYEALEKAEDALSPREPFSLGPYLAPDKYKYAGKLGNIEAELIWAQKWKGDLENTLLDIFGPEISQVIRRCALEPTEMNRQIAERLCSTRQKRPDVALQAYLQYVEAVERVDTLQSKFSRGIQELEQIKREQAAIHRLLGSRPSLTPNISIITQQAATLERHVDLEDDAAVEEFLKRSEKELWAARLRRVQVSNELQDIVVAIAAMNVAESRLLEGLKDKTPSPEDAEAHAALQNRQKEAEQKRKQLLREYAAIDAEIAEKEKILANGPHATPGHKTIDKLKCNLGKVEYAQSVVYLLKKPGETISDYGKSYLKSCWNVVEKTALSMGYKDQVDLFFEELTQGKPVLLEAFDFQLQIEAAVLEAEIEALSQNID